MFIFAACLFQLIFGVFFSYSLTNTATSGMYVVGMVIHAYLDCQNDLEAGQDLPVRLPAIRFLLCSMGLYIPRP